VNIRRILVALDATAGAPPALEGLARLAARLQAELTGMFVEDVNLLRAAGLPFAREIGFPSASSRALDAPAMTRTLKALARHAERALAAAAARAAARWSFRVARGAVPEQLLVAASAADLLVLERPSRHGRRLGSTARQLLARASGTVLLLRQGLEPGPPVVAWLETPADVARVLPVAAVLAGDGAPVVALAGGSPEQCARLRAACAAVAGPAALSFEPLASAADVRRARRHLPARAGLLVLAQESRWLGDEGPDWLAVLPCPVLVVGARTGPP
jgi:nucleotide-binding universal stress UspA family protein